MPRFAKIVCTLGPSTASRAKIRQLIQAGMDVARLNFSHGSHESQLDTIHLVRECAAELGKPVAILQDLQGPKLRVGELPSQGILLTSGAIIRFFMVGEGSEQLEGKNLSLPLDVPNLTKAVKPGNRILLDDGKLELMVTKVNELDIETKVVIGGILKSHKGVNLPGTDLGIARFTEKDHLDLQFGLANHVDYIAISLWNRLKISARSERIIEEIDPSRKNTPIIAKLERPGAIKNLHEIIHTRKALW